MRYPFGQDFVFEYYPLIDDSAFLPSSVALAPALYLFRDMPSRNVAAVGTGNIWSAIIWSWNPTKRCFYFTIAAIDDPEPTSGQIEVPFWLAINHRLQATEQIQTILQRVVLERVIANDASALPTVQEVIDEFQSIKDYAKPEDILGFIRKAQDDVKDDLTIKGYRWSRIHNKERLQRVVTLKSVVRFLLKEIQNSGDKFVFKYTEYKALYDTALAGVKLTYDEDGDSIPDATVQTNNTFIRLIR